VLFRSTLANDAPSGLTAILKLPAPADKLQMFTVDMIVLVPEGTIYKLAAVFADGFVCPKTLYVIAIAVPYAPISKNGCIKLLTVACTLLVMLTPLEK